MADLDGVAGDFGAQGSQQDLGERACGNAGRGFAGGGTLENVAGVVKIKFLRTGEIGVAGTWR